MTAKVIHNIGSHLVDEITGDEVFSCHAGSQRDKLITAEKLRHYFGGDVAVPNVRLERGAHATKLSELPNAEYEMLDRDSVTGLQEGKNVNFSRMQILAPLVKLIGSMLNADTGIKSYTVATLPGAVPGMEALVIDGAGGLVWGDKVIGGGNTIYKTWYNGSAWTVTGK
jgi:hypothetical protein